MSTLPFNIFSKKIISDKILGINPDEDFEVLINQCKLNKINFDYKKLRKAFDLCFDIYRDAVYINRLPKYTHSLSVAMIITKEIPLDENSVISAILHDIWQISDKYDYDYISNEFGKEVADIIDSLHKIRKIDLDFLNQPEEIENYRKFLLALASDFRVILVKLADTLEEMRNSSFMPHDEQVRLARETFEIYNPFANRLGLRNLKWELDDLAFKILNPIEFNTISEYLNENKLQREEYISKFIGTTQERLEKNDFLKRNKISFELSGRAKHVYSIYNKMRFRKKSIDELFDLFAIRVVLNTTDPNICYYVYGIISSVFPSVPETFKDYISSPKKNGYQSIHTAVFGTEGKIVEVQIRTQEMDHYSESGVAAHFKYKTHIESNSVLEKEDIQNWMHIVREIFENQGEENVTQILDEVRSNLFSDEIYAYTPTNEFINLPINSTPLDFAYYIHSDIGNHFVGAKVNGKMVPIGYRIKNGDKVEIITSSKAKPQEDWLEYAISSKARNQIHKFFKTEIRNKEFVGHERWKNELIKRKISIDDLKLSEYLKELNINRISDFYISLADEDLDLDNFIDFLKKKIFEKNADRKLVSQKYDQDIKNVFKEIPNRTIDTEYESLMRSLGVETKVYSINFTGKENYNLVKKIRDFILQSSEILILKFSYEIEKSKVTGELIFESTDSEQADSLIKNLKNLEGLYINQ